jgi:hypothetical protein
MDFSEHELDLMNKSLRLIKDNINQRDKSKLISNELNITLDNAKFIFEQTCLISQEHDLMILETFNDGSFAIVRVNDYKIDRFISNGGFKSLIKKEEKPSIVVNAENAHVGDNSGTYSQLSSNFSNSPQTNSTTAKIDRPDRNNLATKIWKLASENKLISSIILILLVYVIKEVFGIDLS